MGIAVSSIYRPTELALVNLRKVAIHVQPDYEFFTVIRSFIEQNNCLQLETDSVVFGVAAQSMVALFSNVQKISFFGCVLNAQTTQELFSYQLYFQFGRIGRRLPSNFSVHCHFAEFLLNNTF